MVMLIASGCAPIATPTFFIPPTEAPRPPVSVIGVVSPNPQGSPSAGAVVVRTLALPSPTPPCTDGLTYVQDLTVPDGSIMVPGQPVDKEWQVMNSGTCNWDQRYRLKLISGDAMGANPLQPLYPARAGADATLRIVFTAPQSTGLYECQWQAVNPEGIPFGDAFYMQISVSP
jgi:hypothetical protein